MQEIPGAIDMRPYSGQWIAEESVEGKIDEVRVVASASEYYLVLKELERLGKDQHNVGIWKVPTAASAAML
ncbi:MAG: hypothetical protein ACREN8_13530 [Candidatus Dormibacteraceae bacterium]